MGNIETVLSSSIARPRPFVLLRIRYFGTSFFGSQKEKRPGRNMAFKLREILSQIRVLRKPGGSRTRIQRKRIGEKLKDFVEIVRLEISRKANYRFFSPSEQ